MKRRLLWFPLAAFGLALILVRPALLSIAILGCAGGVVVAILVAYRLRWRQAFDSRNTRFAIGSISLASILIGSALALINTTDQKSPLILPSYRQQTPGLGPPGLRRLRPVPSIQYRSVIEFDDITNSWKITEVIRVSQSTAAEMASITSTAPHQLRRQSEGSLLFERVAAPMGFLDSKWQYRGPPYSSDTVLVFKRERRLSIEMPAWPPTTVDTLRIGEIVSGPLSNVFVLGKDSQIEIRAPENFVREVDFPAAKRQFAGEDIFTLHLDGLEDDASLRNLRIRIADGLGRSSIYIALESLTAWDLVKVFFGGIPFLVVGYFVTRWLKSRAPDQPS